MSRSVASGSSAETETRQAPAIHGEVEVLRLAPQGKLALGPDGSADLVVTFRSVHDWTQDGIENEVFTAAFKVLKPGHETRRPR